MSRMCLLKRAAYRTGALHAAFRARRRDALTVVMFHRVLPAGSPCWEDADPTYTLSDELFGECVSFFARNYSVVGTDRVLEALNGGAPLPEWPLLITFDDGWADNATCAAPILSALRLPAVVFVVPDAVRDADNWWWQEALTFAARQGRLTPEVAEELWCLGGDDPSPETGNPELLFGLMRRLASLDPVARRSVLEPLAPPRPARQMLTEGQVKDLAAGGVAIGAHGATHIPLTLVPDAAEELERAWRDLSGLACMRSGEGPTTLSFPHGRYSAEIVEAARRAGYRAIFTSDPYLNRLSHGRPCSDVLGRISIEASTITDRRGRFRPELLLLWLSSRPVRALSGEPPV